MSLRAKASARARNGVVLAGIGALVGADLCFAFVPSVLGEWAQRCHGMAKGHCVCLHAFRPARPARRPPPRLPPAALALPPGMPLQAWWRAPVCWVCTWR